MNDPDGYLTINLFDYNFSQSVCSTEYQVPQHIRYTRGLMEWNGITIFTDAFIHNPIVSQVKSPVKIGWLREPRCLHPPEYEAAERPDIQSQFDLVLTYDINLLKNPKFSFCPYAGTWIPKSHWGGTDKTRKISMLYGEKNTTAGHKLRHAIGEALNASGIHFYGAKGKPTTYSWQTKYEVLSEYRFSIVTETCCEYNLFSEILLDCFINKTIPIFWGCPNIGRYFDETGIIEFSTVAELKDIVSEIMRFGNKLYQKMTWPIEANYREAAKYAVTEDWMYRNVDFNGLLESARGRSLTQ